LSGAGPDACVECVGLHYCHNLLHRVEMALQVETDTPEVLNEVLRACRKGGRVAIMGA
jgi:threonine dehydrogenase-like Zn-dependent dehydrogenase